MGLAVYPRASFAWGVEGSVARMRHCARNGGIGRICIGLNPYRQKLSFARACYAMAKLMQASLCSFGLNAAFGEVGLCVAYGFFAALNDYRRCSGEHGLGVLLTVKSYDNLGFMVHD